MKVRKGFTLIELILVMGLTAALISIVSINAIRPQISTSLSAATSVLITDIKNQQLKTMTGEANMNHGIYFETNKYTLFNGVSYNASDPTNFEVALADGIEFSSIGFSGNTLLFEKDGSYTTYAGSDVSLTITHSAGDQKVVTFNKYGIPNEN